MSQARLLRERHRALGAVWSETAGWELPAHYGDVRTEWEHVRRRVGLMDLSHHGLLRILGRDRRTWLHGMVTNDVRGLADGRGVYAAALNVQGHMLTDMRLFAVEDALLIELPPGTADRIAETFDQFLMMEKAEIQNASAEIQLLSLQGPASPKVATTLGVDARAMDPLEIRTVTLGAERSGWLARVERAGEPGFDVWVPSDLLEPVWDRLLQAARAAGGGPVGHEALNILRVEAGIPWWGWELDESIVPFEARLESAISFTKGCYIGQEVIARIEARGRVNNLMVGLSLGAASPPPSRTPIHAGGKAVGRTATAVRSPVRDETIALAFLRREHSDPGTRVSLSPDGTDVSATVVELPFYGGLSRE